MRIRQRAFVNISHYKTKEDFRKLWQYVILCSDDSDRNIIQFVDNKLCFVPMEATIELDEMA